MKTIRELTKLSNGKELDIKYPIELKDKDGRVVYGEYYHGFWSKREWKDDKRVYYENSNGFWEKHEYDTDGNAVYHEDSEGYCWKKERINK